jgi:hypothetical protein
VAGHLVEDYLPERVIYVDPSFGEPRGLKGVIGRERVQKLAVPTREQLIKQHPAWTSEQIDLDLANLERWDPETAHGVRDRAVVHAPEVPLVPSLVVLAEKNGQVGTGPSVKLAEAGFQVRVVPGGGLTVFRDDLAAFVASIRDWL